MSIFKKIIEKLSKNENEPFLFLYLQCNCCKEKIKLRIHKNTDLSPAYPDESSSAEACYILRKEAMDSKCFNLIQVNIEFDRSYRIINQQVKGGKLLTKEEFEK